MWFPWIFGNNLPEAHDVILKLILFKLKFLPYALILEKMWSKLFLVISKVLLGKLSSTFLERKTYYWKWNIDRRHIYDDQKFIKFRRAGWIISFDFIIVFLWCCVTKIEKFVLLNPGVRNIWVLCNKILMRYCMSVTHHHQNTIPSLLISFRCMFHSFTHALNTYILFKITWMSY